MLVTRPKNNSSPANGFHLPYKRVSPAGYTPLESKLIPRTSSYLDLGTTTKHLSKSKIRKRVSETLEIKRKTRLKLTGFLSQLGQADYAESMAKCGEKWSVFTCGEHVIAKVPFHRCNIRFCPMCAQRRANRFVKKHLLYCLEFLKQNSFYKPCLLTLTQLKINGETKKNARARILESFKKLHRRKFFNEYFAGGVWACEITESETGNHAHLHIVIFRRKFIDEKLLKSEWSKVSKGAKNLNIKLIDDLEDGLRECIKYIAKPMPAEKLTLNSVREILQLKGLRMIDTFGEFRKFCQTYELPETEDLESDKPEFAPGDCCPNCDKPLFERILTHAELVAHYRRRESVLLPIRVFKE
jgi:plasmid rolling circle replication initiator protein Rep